MTAQEFRDWRKRLGLTQAGAAAVLGLSVETVRAWEYGKRRVSMPRVLGLACLYLETQGINQAPAR